MLPSGGIKLGTQPLRDVGVLAIESRAANKCARTE